MIDLSQIQVTWEAFMGIISGGYPILGIIWFINPLRRGIIRVLRDIMVLDDKRGSMYI